MKKYFSIAILLSFIFIISCEKDDICLEDTTPNLIIKFFDKTNDTLVKKVPSLTVWIHEKDTLYLNVSLDSIIVPLDLNTDKTLLKLSSSNSVDEINFSYLRNDIFVSRSCGYKTIFDEFNIKSKTNQWIDSISINTSIIENETASHINIYH